MTILWWVLGAVGLVVALFVLLHLIGTLLPAGHVVGRALRLRQPADVVWGVITDFATVPTWHAHVKKVERQADQNGHEVWTEYHKGAGTPLRLVTTECVPPCRLVRTIDDGQQFFRGRWEFDLTAEGATCRLTITEHGEILKPFVRTLARWFFDPALYLDLYLKALAGKFNEEPAIQNAPHFPHSSVVKV